MYAIHLLLSALLVASLDLTLKRLAFRCFGMRPLGPLAGLRLRCVVNQKRRTPARREVVLLAILAIWLCGLVVLVPALQHPIVPIALGAALGGSLGNVLDHLSRGGVLDYIDLGWWPVFNLADVAIVVGVALALLVSWDRWFAMAGTPLGAS